MDMETHTAWEAIVQACLDPTGKVGPLMKLSPSKIQVL